jgi:hypothetical protein
MFPHFIEKLSDIPPAERGEENAIEKRWNDKNNRKLKKITR